MEKCELSSEKVYYYRLFMLINFQLALITSLASIY